MLKVIKLTLALLVVLFFNSCKKECPPCQDPTNPKCENYNPCLSKKPVTADFQIGQVASAAYNHNSEKYRKAFFVDSIFPKRCAISFRAEEKDAKYTWYLGAEILDSKEITRVFSDLPLGKYTVTLIVEKIPDTLCFPNDDGKDTVTKNFYLVEYCDLNTTGYYKGVIDDSKDSVIWWMDVCTIENNILKDSNSIIDRCGSLKLVLGGGINKTIDPDDSTKIDPYDITNGTYLIGNNRAYVGWEKGGGRFTGVGDFEIEFGPKQTVDFTYRTWCKYYRFRGRKLKNK
jgi:hypothetical protein